MRECALCGRTLWPGHYAYQLTGGAFDDDDEFEEAIVLDIEYICSHCFQPYRSVKA